MFTYESKNIELVKRLMMDSIPINMSHCLKNKGSVQIAFHIVKLKVMFTFTHHKNNVIVLATLVFLLRTVKKAQISFSEHILFVCLSVRQ